MSAMEEFEISVVSLKKKNVAAFYKPIIYPYNFVLKVQTFVNLRINTID
jgi:hypothetical protein